MPQPSPSIVRPQDIPHLLQSYRHRWIVPTLVITLLAAGYAVIRPNTWQASQAMLLRDEAIGSISPLGDFLDTDARKTAQETVLELTRSHAVLSAALAQVGPGKRNRRSTLWPTPRDIDDAQEAVAVSAPQGTEFGQSEVFYLNVKQDDRDRAIALAAAVGDQIEFCLQGLRDQKARGTVDELVQRTMLARADLDRATQQLAAVEKQVGSDLIELRTLSEVGSGESNLRRTLTEIKNELRQATSTQHDQERLLALLAAARVDPKQLVATPNMLLESQPALRRLKDGLVDAQLQTAQLLGTMSLDHPRVQGAVAAADEIKNHLHRELEIAVRGLQAELHLSSTRVDSLQQQLNQAKGRLDRLVELRASYSNLVAEVRHRSDMLRAAQENLSNAKASLAAAHSASLITRLDGPTTGSHPLGPSRKTIVLAGAIGGLACGLGLLFLTVPLPQTSDAGEPGVTDHAGQEVPAGTPTDHPLTAVMSNGASALDGVHSLSLKEALTRLAHRSPCSN